MAAEIDRENLINRLDPIKYESQGNESQTHLEQMSIAAVLLQLADVNHEQEYELCRNTAQHLLGAVNEPEDIVLE